MERLVSVSRSFFVNAPQYERFIDPLRCPTWNSTFPVNSFFSSSHDGEVGPDEVSEGHAMLRVDIHPRRLYRGHAGWVGLVSSHSSHHNIT